MKDFMGVLNDCRHLPLDLATLLTKPGSFRLEQAKAKVAGSKVGAC